MNFIKNFSKFKLIKENLNETKTFFEKNQDIILSYYKFIFDNCGNATVIEEFQSKWNQLLEHIKKNFTSSFTEFKNWISNESKTRLKLTLKQNINNWQKQNKDSLNVISEFETMLGFSLGGNNLQRVDTRTDKNCFDNETLGLVQLLPHNFTRKGKDVICKETPEFDPNKKSILLMPGGDGKPAVDFEHIAKKLTDYNLFSFNYDQNDLGGKLKDPQGPVRDDIEKYSKQMAEDANEKISNEFSVVGFSLGTTMAYFAHKTFTKFNNKIVCIDAGLPPESTGDPSDPDVHNKDLEIQVIDMMTGNAPQKYNCMRKSKIEESEQRSVGPEHVAEFRYKYKEDFDVDKIEEELRSSTVGQYGKAPFSKKGYTVDDFDFELQDEYEEFKKDKKLLYEYVDDPKGDDRSHTYVDNKPSSAFKNGKKISLEEAQKLEKSLTDDDVWIVRDKWEGSSDDKKEFWFEQNLRNLYLWVVEHKGRTGKTISKGENFGNVQVLYLKAGGTTKKITKEEIAEELEKRPLSNNTKIEIIPNCVHGDMLEDQTSSNIIADKIIAFLK